MRDYYDNDKYPSPSPKKTKASPSFPSVEDTTKTLYKDLPQIPILFTSNPDRVLYKLP